MAFELTHFRVRDADCRCSHGPLGPHDDWAIHTPAACGRTYDDYLAARKRAEGMDR